MYTQTSLTLNDNAHIQQLLLYYLCIPLPYRISGSSQGQGWRNGKNRTVGYKGGLRVGCTVGGCLYPSL